uniref:Uncharacterized protein n=1 Tax=Chenopodium quinoa TaxID=63459 RepID=A0A803L8C4_CHEQI
MGVANQVTLGDGKKANVEGRGVIAVNSKANNTKYIHDVLYVPNLTHNLLSVGQLVQRGYSANFDNGECIVTDKKSGTILAKVQMADNKVFPLHMPQKKLALQANVMDESYLWHLRYGHLNQKGLQLLKQKDMVVGLPHIDRNIQVCEGCIYGKMHHLPFPKTSWRAKAPLELVHADIFGPTRNPSLQNKSRIKLHRSRKWFTFAEVHSRRELLAEVHLAEDQAPSRGSPLPRWFVRAKAHPSRSSSKPKVVHSSRSSSKPKVAHQNRGCVAKYGRHLVVRIDDFKSLCVQTSSVATGGNGSSLSVAVSGRSMMKFESGYLVETVFDGSKLGIEPYSVEVLPTGELLIVDSASSNLYRISSALSLYSRPKLVAGSPEGYSGHVDGKYREARLNHPKGVAVDDRGNIYVADTMDMAIRKICDTGVTTIAGGKWSNRGGHVDGPSDEAKFSNDFDVVYVGSSCSLLLPS